MPFAEDGAPELLRKVLAGGVLEVRETPERMERVPLPRARHRHAGRRAPDPELHRRCIAPIDGCADAPSRRPDPDPPQHRSFRASASTSRRTSTARGLDIRVAVLSGARRPGPQPARDPAAAADHERLRSRDAPGGARALRTVRRRVHRDDADGGGALQADDQRQALHPVRHRRTSSTRSPTRARPGLRSHPSRLPAQLSAHAGHAGPRVRGGAVPGQGHDAARGLQPQLVPARARRDARQRGTAGAPGASWRSATSISRTRIVGHSRHGLQGRERRSARFPELQAAQAPRAGGARRCSAPIPTCRDPALVPLERVLADADVLFVGDAPPGLPGAADPSGQGPVRRLELRRRSATRVEGPRHRLGRLHRRVPRPGAARAGARGRRASTTTPSTAGSRRATSATRGYTFVEGDAKDVDAPGGARADVRSLRGRRRPHRRHLVLPRVRLRPAGGERAHHRRHASTPRIAAFRKGRARRRSPCSRAAWSSRTPPSFPRRRATCANARRRPAPTASRSSPASTSPAARGSSTSFPYTICRPFNCVGIGESRALGGKEIPSGNVKLAMSHVVPDLVQKVLKGQDPLHILGSGEQIRCYTYGGDLARGIADAMFHPAAANEDFNLSTPTSTTRPRARRRRSGRRSTGRPVREALSLRERPAVPLRRRPRAFRIRARRGAVLGFEATTGSPRCSTRSCRGFDGDRGGTHLTDVTQGIAPGIRSSCRSTTKARTSPPSAGRCSRRRRDTSC